MVLAEEAWLFKPPADDDFLTFVGVLPLEVAETVDAAEPMVGVGASPSEPFSAKATSESWANPIESGS